MRISRTAALAATVGVLTVLGVGPAGAQTPPPTLTGEALVAVAPASPTPHLAGTCNPDGTTILTYSVTDSLIDPTQNLGGGPYVGTFSEEVTVTIGPQTGPAVPEGFLSGSQGWPTGPVTGLEATFTINSPTAIVTGTKRLDLGVPPLAFPPPFATSPGAENRGYCRDIDGEVKPAFPLAPPFYGYNRGVDAATVTYEATIETADGIFFDRGRTRVIIRNRCADFAPPPDGGICFPDNEDTFVEIFESDLAAPEPAVTGGTATGGGRVGELQFGFNAHGDDGPKGNCTVKDGAVTLRCLDVTSYVQSGTHVTFFGNATVNGAPTTYRIDVDDLAEPGAGQDIFRVQTASGYSGGGVLTEGNVQLH